MQNRKAIMRLVAVGLLLYAMVSLLAINRQLADTQRLRDTLARQAEELRREQESLEEKLAAYGQDAEMRRLAWQRLGMVMPGETVYYFIGERDGTLGQTERVGYGLGNRECIGR